MSGEGLEPGGSACFHLKKRTERQTREREREGERGRERERERGRTKRRERGGRDETEREMDEREGEKEK